MNLDFNETQQLLKETVAGFLESSAPYDRTRKLEAEQGWDAELWQRVCEQGFLGLAFDESLGGGGGSLLELGLLVEEFARRAVMVPILEVAVAGRALQADPALAADWVPRILAGRAVPVPAILESADDFGKMTLEVGPDGLLSGTKYFVDYGQHATHHLVAAVEGGEPAFFLVETGAAGVECEALLSVGRTPVAVARYSSAAAQRVAGAGQVPGAVVLARALAALQCVGSMQTSLDMTVAYANTREQFGQTIGRFQAVRHHCANMASRVASARILALEALSALDRGEDAGVRVAAAKAAASRSAPEVLMLGHQVHGGNGVIEENDLYFFTLRGKERSLAWGSVEECLAVMAADIPQEVEWM